MLDIFFITNIANSTFNLHCGILFNIKAVQGNFKDLFHFLFFFFFRHYFRLHLDAIDFVNFQEIEF